MKRRDEVSWSDDMDRAMDKNPEMFGMVIDDHGNPVVSESNRADARAQRGACASCGHIRMDPIHDMRSEGYHPYSR